MRRWVITGFAALLAAATSAYAGAAEQAGFQTAISGFVPVICHADVVGAPVQPANGFTDLGTLQEFCNDGAGYQVWVDSAPGISTVALFVDGRRIALSSTGATMISSSATPARELHHLQLAGKNPQTISIRIVAL